MGIQIGQNTQVQDIFITSNNLSNVNTNTINIGETDIVVLIYLILKVYNIHYIFHQQ